MTAVARGTDVLTDSYYETGFEGYFTVEDVNGNDVTAQFNVTAVPGKLAIKPRTVEIASGSGTKEYDGTPLTNETITIGGDGFIDGDLVSARATGSRLVVGHSYNWIAYELRQDMSASNYIVNTNAGILRVTDRAEGKKFEITVTANGGSAKYDGTAHTVSGYTVSGTQASDFTETTDGYRFSVGGVSYTLSGLTTMLVTGTGAVNAGTYDVLLEGRAIIKDTDGNDVTDQFKVNTVDSTLVIAKRTVLLTSASLTEQYSGKELTAPSVEVSGDGFADGEGASYVFADTAKVSRPNTSAENTFDYVLNTNTNSGNYDITKKPGKLTLTGREGEAKYELLARANSVTWTYDGQNHTVGGFATPDTYEVDGAVFTLTGLTAEEVTARDYQAGGYPVNITGTAVVTDEFGNDVTDQFNVKTQNGTLTINPRSILLTSASAQKAYDGTALTAQSVTDTLNLAGGSSEAGFVGGDGATYTFTGTRTLVGTVENTFSYTLNEGTKAANYIIATAYGTLNVQNRGSAEAPRYTIALQPVSDEVVYNGREQSAEGFETTSFTFDGQTYEVTGITSAARGTEPGVYTSTYSGMAVVKNAAGEDVTDQFIIDTTAKGTLTIRGVYTLTINYVDGAGTTLAPSYVGRFAEGTAFGPITSPAVAGYTPNYASVSSPESGMPNRDVTVNVVYTAVPTAAAPADDTEVTPPGDGTTPDNTTDDGTPGTGGADTALTTPAPVVATPVTPTPGAADNGGNGNTEINEEEPPRGVITFDENGNAEIVEIEEEPTALASGSDDAAWALINLIAAILTVILCIVLLVTWFIGKKKEEDEDEEERRESKEKKEEDEDEEKTKRHTVLRLLSIIPAVASVIIFILTENMKNPMILVDRWTLLMIVLLIVEILLAFFSRKKKDDEKDDEEDSTVKA
jgi:NADH:ubiquinone oxidoreductase subunit 3 (subunit A)